MSGAMRYGEFWPIYLRLHSRPGTRALHLGGTLAAVVLLGLAAGRMDWRWAAAAVAVGYGAAWTGHALVERNRPATFRHPLLSLAGDFHMLGLFLAGRLERELRRVTGSRAP